MINLTTIRHDPGRIVHVFDTADRHNKPVSALLLTNDEQHLISGGWDNQVKVSTALRLEFHDSILISISPECKKAMGSEHGPSDKNF